MRLPCASISAPEPPIFTELRRRGVGLRASTAVSLPSVSAKTFVPSDLTMSGSSTPASWTLVLDESSPTASDSGAGAVTGVGPEPPSLPPPDGRLPGRQARRDHGPGRRDVAARVADQPGAGGERLQPRGGGALRAVGGRGARGDRGGQGHCHDERASRGAHAPTLLRGGPARGLSGRYFSPT